MSFKHLLDKTRDVTRLPNREVGRAVQVGPGYRATLTIQNSPVTVEFPSPLPGRIPRSATQTSGPPSTIRVVGTQVFIDATSNGDVTLEVTY